MRKRTNERDNRKLSCRRNKIVFFALTFVCLPAFAQQQTPAPEDNDTIFSSETRLVPLNVTVLDSTNGSYGAPVPLATVLLGVDSATPFQGTTDARGQVTFSDPSLVKAQTVTL